MYSIELFSQKHEIKIRKIDLYIHAGLPRASSTIVGTESSIAIYAIS